MAYFLLIILTILSCFLFEFSKLHGTVKTLMASYKLQFKVMSDRSLTDAEKQQLLLKQISQQLLLIAKLIGGILLFVAPFLSLFLLQNLDERLNPDILVTWWGLLIPIITVIFYIIIKRNHGRLLGNR